jgi:hypothetical protein
VAWDGGCPALKLVTNLALQRGVGSFKLLVFLPELRQLSILPLISVNDWTTGME